MELERKEEGRLVEAKKETLLFLSQETLKCKVSPCSKTKTNWIFQRVIQDNNSSAPKCKKKLNSTSAHYAQTKASLIQGALRSEGK